MKILAKWPAALVVLVAGMFAACSQTAKAPDVSASIRTALDQAGLKKVSVDQDRDKGVVTLGGHVAVDADKAQAEALARSLAGGEVVANQIAVLPVGAESDARAMNTDLDKGIEQNLDAALIQNKLHDGVKYAVKSGVVTLTGDVDSQSKRREVAKVAGSVPNVQQVVNELQVKNQKASSSQ
jgi:osmotically-inducible protein OsmY